MKLQLFVRLSACLLLLLLPQGFVGISEKNTLKEIIPFRLRNVDGKQISFTTYPDAKGFIIIFTCNHCPFAKLYTKRLNNLHSKYSVLGVPLLAVNPMDSLLYDDETFEEMQKRAKIEKFAFPYLQDAEQIVGKNFGVQHTPQAFIVWKEQDKWVVRYSGAIDDNGEEPHKAHSFIEQALDDLLHSKTVRVSNTKSLGCTVYFRRTN